jgi:hypothetical protein
MLSLYLSQLKNPAIEDVRATQVSDKPRDDRQWEGGLGEQ